MLNLRRARSPEHLSQSGINMVDLMMWLVIAALLLAAALQSIGFYQQRAYIEQMMSDANGAGSIAMARASTDGGITENILREAVKETATSGDVALVSAYLGNGHFAIEATHPLVNKHRVIYSFSERNDLLPGVNLKKMTSVDLGGVTSAAAACPTDVWFAQYYSEYQDEGIPSKAPEASRCETAPIAYYWNDGGPNIPGIPVDKFAIHWTKNFEVTADTEYEFLISSDNKAWVYLDGKQIIDNSVWYSAPTTQKAYVRVPPGKHNLTIRYTEHAGGASVNFTQKVVK